MSKLTDIGFRAVSRIFLPDLVKRMKAEGVYQMEGGGDGEVEYYLVEDRGAPITIFVFSGIDILYAGLARFEFRKVLGNLADQCNLVFFRDVSRKAYFQGPHGEPNGLDFYAQKVREIQEQLGSRYHVGIGSSGGAVGAMKFAIRCKFDYFIGFSLPVTETVITNWRSQLHTLSNIPQLLREPKGYLEVCLITFAATWAMHGARRKEIFEGYLDEHHPMSPYRVFAEATHRPKTTLVYGAHSRPDRIHAEMMKTFPEVRLHAVPTGRHNTPGYLKEHGQLDAFMHEQLETIFADYEAKHGALPAAIEG